MRTLLPRDAAARGPYRVGLASLDLQDAIQPDRKLPTDVWYPVAAGAPPGDPADHPFGQPHAAERGARPAEGPFPAVLFSHGNSGLRRQSTFLTTHLASWGWVVAAPDHSGNTAFEMAPITDPQRLKQIHLAARRDRPRDLLAVLDTIAAGSPEWPAVDDTRVAACGHSYGGWTAFKMPRLDSRVQAVCGLAPAAEAFVGRAAFERDELPLPDGTASLIIAGLDDVKVELAATVFPLYERLREPRAVVTLRGADHYHFCDGIEVLHTLHQGRIDPRQSQATRPYGELLSEVTTHRLLCGVTTAFLSDFFAGASDPTACLSDSALDEFDPHLSRYSPSAESPPPRADERS